MAKIPYIGTSLYRGSEAGARPFPSSELRGERDWFIELISVKFLAYNARNRKHEHARSSTSTATSGTPHHASSDIEEKCQPQHRKFLVGARENVR
jgi:hypothetical protein